MKVFLKGFKVLLSYFNVFLLVSNSICFASFDFQNKTHCLSPSSEFSMQNNYAKSHVNLPPIPLDEYTIYIDGKTHYTPFWIQQQLTAGVFLRSDKSLTKDELRKKLSEILFEYGHLKNNNDKIDFKLLNDLLKKLIENGLISGNPNEGYLRNIDPLYMSVWADDYTYIQEQLESNIDNEEKLTEILTKLSNASATIKKYPTEANHPVLRGVMSFKDKSNVKKLIKFIRAQQKSNHELFSMPLIDSIILSVDDELKKAFDKVDDLISTEWDKLGNGFVSKYEFHSKNLDFDDIRSKLIEKGYLDEDDKVVKMVDEEFKGYSRLNKEKFSDLKNIFEQADDVTDEKEENFLSWAREENIKVIESMLGEKWIDLHAPNVKGTIYEITPEGQDVAGGLGRVEQYHPLGMVRLGGDVQYIEPYYRKSKLFKGQDSNYGPGGNVAVKVKGRKLYKTIKVDFSEKLKGVKVNVYKGINERGVRVWLLRDEDGQEFSDENIKKFIIEMFAYGGEENPSQQDFSVFFTKAAYGFIESEEREKKTKIEAEGNKWENPIANSNDAQSALTPLWRVIKMVKISDMLESGKDENGKQLTRKEQVDLKAELEFVYNLVMLMTNHTYKNMDFLGVYNDYWRNKFLNWGIPEELHWLLIAEGTHGEMNLTTAGLRCAEIAKSVAAIHAFENQEYVPNVDLRGISNGDDIKASTVKLREIIKELYGEKNPDELNVKEVILVKKNTKNKVKEEQIEVISNQIKAAEGIVDGLGENRDKLDDLRKNQAWDKDLIKSTEEKIEEQEKYADRLLYLNDLLMAFKEFDTDQKVFAYIGRWVPEKAGVERAFVEDTLRALLEKGVQVVIDGNVQPYKDSEDVGNHMKTLMYKLNKEMREKPARTALSILEDSEILKKTLKEVIKKSKEVLEGSEEASKETLREVLKEAIERSKEVLEGDEAAKEILNDALEALKTDFKGRLIFKDAFSLDEHLLLMPAVDMQINDSDRHTGACEITETNAMSNFAIQFSPPFIEGLIGKQGAPINYIKKTGNTVYPVDDRWDSYKAAMLRIADMDANELTHYQINSRNLSQVLEARLTAAAYLRLINEKMVNSKEIMKNFLKNIKRAPREVEIRQVQVEVVSGEDRGVYRVHNSFKAGVNEELLVRYFVNLDGVAPDSVRSKLNFSDGTEIPMNLTSLDGEIAIFEGRVKKSHPGIVSFSLSSGIKDVMKKDARNVIVIENEADYSGGEKKFDYTVTENKNGSKKIKFKLNTHVGGKHSLHYGIPTLGEGWKFVNGNETTIELDENNEATINLPKGVNALAFVVQIDKNPNNNAGLNFFLRLSDEPYFDLVKTLGVKDFDGAPIKDSECAVAA